MPVSDDAIISEWTSNFPEAMEKYGITASILARQLKSELHAKETKFIKIRSIINPKSQAGDGTRCQAENAPDCAPPSKRGRLKSGYRTVCKGGPLGDTVIAVDCIAWGVRQAARMDAQKLLGAYPAAKVAVGGDPDNPIRITGLTDAELLDIARGSGGGTSTP